MKRSKQKNVRKYPAKDSRNPIKQREPSVRVKEDWKVIEEIEFLNP